MEEVWKEIPGYPRYEVSTFGNVRSWKTNGVPKKLIVSKSKKSSNQVSLCKNGIIKSYKICFIVCWTFLGEKKYNEKIERIDNNVKNDRLENLKYIEYEPKDPDLEKKKVEEFKELFSEVSKASKDSGLSQEAADFIRGLDFTEEDKLYEEEEKGHSFRYCKYCQIELPIQKYPTDACTKYTNPGCPGLEIEKYYKEKFLVGV